MNYRTLLLTGLLIPLSAPAQEAMSFSKSLDVRVFGERLVRQSDSLLNPNNVVADLPDSTATADAIAQLAGRGDTFDFKLRGRVFGQHAYGAPNPDNDGYLSQAYTRFLAGGRTSFTVGRILLTWGPGQLRSPSNPFYFNAGKLEPLRELTGLDAASFLYSGDVMSLQLIRVFDSGHTSGSQGEDFRGSQTGSADYTNTNVVKVVSQGSEWRSSVVAAQTADNSTYFGAYGQWVASDALLVYAEFGSGTRPGYLDPAIFRLQSPGPRKNTALLGGSYTLENGQTVYGEFLYNGYGYSRSQEKAFFDTVANNGTVDTLRTASVMSGMLIGRRYVSVIWQSNPQDDTIFWQGTLVANVDDQSKQAIGYVERNLTSHTTLFGYFTKSFGGSRRDFGSIVDSSVLLGVKIYVF